MSKFLRPYTIADDARDGWVVTYKESLVEVMVDSSIGGNGDRRWLYSVFLIT